MKTFLPYNFLFKSKFLTILFQCSTFLHICILFFILFILKKKYIKYLKEISALEKYTVFTILIFLPYQNIYLYTKTFFLNFFYLRFEITVFRNYKITTYVSLVFPIFSKSSPLCNFLIFPHTDIVSILI